jgi:flagellar motility protein MotE (MotC chaperone)
LICSEARDAKDRAEDGHMVAMERMGTMMRENSKLSDQIRQVDRKHKDEIRDLESMMKRRGDEHEKAMSELESMIKGMETEFEAAKKALLKSHEGELASINLLLDDARR